MNRRSLTALAAAGAFFAAALLMLGPTELRAQCLDKTACSEIKAEFAKLKPEFRATKQDLKKGRRMLKSLKPGSDRWLAKKAELKRLKKGFKQLKRELKALKQDYRHQGCSAC